MSRRQAPSVEPFGRDLAVLRDVGRLGHTGADQLQRLHFAEGSEVGRRRRAQAVLRRLTEDGYLHRLPRRVGGTGSGSAGFVYCLGYRGQRLVFPTLFPGRRARTPEEVGTSFVRHSLAVAELVVALVESERDGGCSDLVLETEPSVWRDYLGTHGDVFVVQLDADLRGGGREDDAARVGRARHVFEVLEVGVVGVAEFPLLDDPPQLQEIVWVNRKRFWLYF